LLLLGLGSVRCLCFPPEGGAFLKGPREEDAEATGASYSIFYDAYQWRLFKFHFPYAKCPGSGTEIIPGKHSDTRIKPLPLTNGHGRCITVTPERALLSFGEWPLHIAIINL
jgi:hypothetical protein